MSIAFAKRICAYTYMYIYMVVQLQDFLVQQLPSFITHSTFTHKANLKIPENLLIKLERGAV